MGPLAIPHHDGLVYRIRLATDADVGKIRLLVNAAYQELADLGLNYTATYQDDEITRSRMSEGRTFLLLAGEEIVGTISMREENETGDRRTAYLSQFGIAPELKKRGLGTLLMDFVETLAKNEGYGGIQLDTAKPAEHLVRLYERRGYRIAGETRFEGKTYESWIFEKVFE